MLSHGDFGWSVRQEYSAAAVLALSVVLVVAAVPAEARPLDDVIESGRITIFVYDDYAPYSWRDDSGEMVGIDVDLAKELAAYHDLELDLLVRGADETVDDDLRVNVWRGDIVYNKAADIMLHVPYDRQLEIRSESLAILFNPYFGEEFAVAVNRERIPELTTFGSFVTRPIAVEVDTAGDFFLSNAFNGQLHGSIRRGRLFGDAVDLFRNEEVAALMATRAQAEWVSYTSPDLDIYIAKPPMPGIVRKEWPIAMAVRHDSRDLGYAMGEALQQLIESGRLAEICAAYGVTYVPPHLE